MSIEVLRQVKVRANLDPDFTAPTLKQVEQALTMIHFYLEKNMPVAVHCIAGLVVQALFLPVILLERENLQVRP